MEIIHRDINKPTLPDDRKAKAKKIVKLDYYYYYDLSEQIKALQKAVAHERGENHRFREEIRSLLQQRL